MLPDPDTRDLEWYFGPQELSQAPGSLMGLGAGAGAGGSTFGEQLERAELLYTGSDGKTVPPSGRMEQVLHVVPRGEQGAGQLRMRLAPWPHIFVKKTRPPPPGVLPSGGPDPRPATDDQIAHVHAAYRARLERRERIAARLERVSGEEYSALRALYGPLGLYWLNRPQERTFALLSLTKVGERHRNVAGTAAAAKVEGESGFSTERWLLEVAFEAPAPKWLGAARTQAEGLQRQAERAWRRTAPPRARPEASVDEDPPQPSTTLHNPPQTATGEQGALRSG
jgi:hypothetical protein